MHAACVCLSAAPQDLVLPQMKAPDQFDYSPLLGAAPLVRDVLFMFRQATPVLSSQWSVAC